MARKKYVYSTVENVNTLRLTISFEKLDSIDVVKEAYYILQTLEKKKAAYIYKAIVEYDKNSNKNKELLKAVSRCRVAGLLKDMYHLDTIDDVKDLLSISLDSNDFMQICNSIPKEQKLRRMLCGFTIGNPETEKLHTRLFDMSVNERVMLISNAVVEYVLSGFDKNMDNIMAIKFLKNSIIEYNNSENKDAVANNFKLMVDFYN